MKPLFSLLPIYLFLTFTSHTLLAQDSKEAEIKQLENIEREAVLKSDSVTLFNKIWSEKMVVNTPLNVVGTVEGAMRHLRAGGLKYLSFERNIEKITFNDDIAIVMGGEVVKPQGTQPNA